MVQMDSEQQELLKVIGDFLEQGHADSIAAMFRRDPSLYQLTGHLLRDERFTVRVGAAVLFEELVNTSAGDVVKAIPVLKPLLNDDISWVRGEAVNIIGIIGTVEALELLPPMLGDPDPQVREIAEYFLEG